MLHPRCLEPDFWAEVMAENMGLSPGGLLDRTLEARDLEHEADLAEEDPRKRPPYSPRTREIAVELWLRGMEPAAVDDLLDLPAGATAGTVAASPMHPLAREVVFAHLAGVPATRISRSLKVSRDTVQSIITGQLHEAPLLDEKRATGRRLYPVIVKLYREGHTYKAIAAKLSRPDAPVTVDRVRQCLKRARLRGEITDYRPGPHLHQRRGRT